MAIATLAACYNNQQVFRGVVKIRKGQAVTLMMDATNIQAVKAIMYQYVEEVGSAVCFESFLALPVPVFEVELGIHGDLFILSLAQWWWGVVILTLPTLVTFLAWTKLCLLCSLGLCLC